MRLGDIHLTHLFHIYYGQVQSHLLDIKKKQVFHTDK